MLKPKVFPYKMGSVGASAIAHGLGCLQIRSDGRYRPKAGHLIINWGNSHPPTSWAPRPDLTVLNNVANVARAINKIDTFHCLHAHGVKVPPFTIRKQEALGFFNDHGIVVCRTKIDGKGGNGIVIAHNPQELVDAPLYTRHVRHKNEYRVHVVNGKIIDFAQKKKRNGAEDVNILVRNHGDWIFARNGIELPEPCSTAAIAAVSALGLDFGAVDIGYRVGDGKAFVFEVNTAPGMSDGSTSAESYAKAFKEICNVT